MKPASSGTSNVGSQAAEPPKKVATKAKAKPVAKDKAKKRKGAKAEWMICLFLGYILCDALDQCVKLWERSVFLDTLHCQSCYQLDLP